MTLPESFSSEARKLLQELLKEMPSDWVSLSKQERERMLQRVDNAISDLRVHLNAKLDQSYSAFLAKDRPHFAALAESMTIKDGDIKLVIKTPQSATPAEIYAHSGRYHITLVEGQVDWVANADRAEWSGLEPQDA